jgi:hypothetical protein
MMYGLFGGLGLFEVTHAGSVFTIKDDAETLWSSSRPIQRDRCLKARAAGIYNIILNYPWPTGMGLLEMFKTVKLDVRDFGHGNLSGLAEYLDAIDNTDLELPMVYYTDAEWFMTLYRRHLVTLCDNHREMLINNFLCYPPKEGSLSSPIA